MQQDHRTGAPIALSAIPTPRQRRRKGAVAAQAKGKAIVYLRVSTSEQAEDGNSIESQEARCRALCEARGLTVVDTFVDAGWSGGRLERPELSALREAVKASRASVVVVYAIDRLSRSQRDTLTLLEEFEASGAGLAVASQPFDTTTPAGRAMLGMLAVFAELQRAEIRERTKAALQRKRDAKLATNRLPFGVERAGAGYQIDAAEWPIVARILSERAQGATCAAIADNLNSDGVPAATALRGERRGLVTGPGKWHAATVAAICRNPVVLSLPQSRTTWTSPCTSRTVTTRETREVTDAASYGDAAPKSHA
jgi:DNA invertase Pin-like site-specific DNA recombinase